MMIYILDIKNILQACFCFDFKKIFNYFFSIISLLILLFHFDFDKKFYFFMEKLNEIEHF